MPGKKHKLLISMDEDYCLFGIASDEPDYKLCWRINQSLGFDLVKTEDLSLYEKKLGEEQLFSIFLYEEEKSMLTFRIISNRAENGYFLQELRNIDYLVHIQGDIYLDHMQNLHSSLTAISSVRMCVPVDLSRIKNKERLMLW